MVPSMRTFGMFTLKKRKSKKQDKNQGTATIYLNLIEDQSMIQYVYS